MTTPKKPRSAQTAQGRTREQVVASLGAHIRNIPNPSEALQLLAVTLCSQNIGYIANPSEAVQLAAVREQSHAIDFIKNPTLNVQMEATSSSGDTLQFIKNPSLEVQENALREYGGAIRFIDCPSEELQLLAVDADGLFVHWIESPTINTIGRAIARTPYIVFDDTLSDKITPEVLRQIQPGLDLLVEYIKDLVDTTDARVELFSATVAMRPVPGQDQALPEHIAM